MISKDRGASQIVVTINALAFLYIYLTTELLGIFGKLSIINNRIVFSILLILVLVGFVVTIGKKLRITRDIQSIIFISFAIIMLFMACVTVPHNFDSMTYHLPRVMHWIQNGSLEYWYTSDVREVCSQPLAEYTLLNLFCLIGNDQLFNVPQWYGYVFCTLLTVFILQEMRVRSEYVFVGMILVMTTPIVIAEGVTTQNDLFSTIWPLTFLYFSIVLSNKTKLDMAKENILIGVVLGVTAGLAFLSKAQSVIPIAFISIWLLIERIKKKDRANVLVIYPCMIVFIALLLAMPYFVRNYRYCGDILASAYFDKLSISSYDLRGIILNCYKNWTMGAKTYTSILINRMLYKSAYIVAGILGMQMNDARFALDEISYDAFKISDYSNYSMDTASASFVSWIFVIMACFVIVRKILARKNKANQRDKNIGLRIALVFSILTPMCYIKWQPWIMRLLIPSYFLMVIYIVLVWNDFVGEQNDTAKKMVTIALPIVLLFLSTSAIYFDAIWVSAGLKGDDRLEWYLEDDESRARYRDLVNYIGEDNDYENIGLYLGYNVPEYPIWYALKKEDNQIFHINMRAQESTPVPDVIIRLFEGEGSLGEHLEYAGRNFECEYLILDDEEYSVWKPVE